jgi:hypothetical protein
MQAETSRFRFEFSDVLADLKVDAGGTMVSVPLKNIGAVGPGAADTANVNTRQTYTLRIIRGDSRSGRADAATDGNGESVLRKPVDNIGTKSIPDYASYANDHTYDVTIPGCGDGRVFVGQRKEGFAVNLGAVFDLVNLNPLGPPNAVPNTMADKNVTRLPRNKSEGASCARPTPSSAVGRPRVFPGSLDQSTPRLIARRARHSGGSVVQVSRLGMPLVNEVVIGLRDRIVSTRANPRTMPNSLPTSPTTCRHWSAVSGTAVTSCFAYRSGCGVLDRHQDLNRRSQLCRLRCRGSNATNYAGGAARRRLVCWAASGWLSQRPPRRR